MLHTYIALLRGVNVGGHNLVRMPALKQVCETLGYAEAATYLQSGNLVFDAPPQPEAEIAAGLEEAIAAAFGLKIRVLVRTPGELRAILAANPFAGGGDFEPRKLVVLFLPGAPDGDRVAGLQLPPGSPEEFIVLGREIFVYYPDGMGRSKLNAAFFEKGLKLQITARNWNTVEALHAMAAVREKGDREA